jgi:hypothetical protein
MLLFQQSVLMDLQAVDKKKLYGRFEHTQGPETENCFVAKKHPPSFKFAPKKYVFIYILKFL